MPEVPLDLARVIARPSMTPKAERLFASGPGANDNRHGTSDPNPQGCVFRDDITRCSEVGPHAIKKSALAWVGVVLIKIATMHDRHIVNPHDVPGFEGKAKFHVGAFGDFFDAGKGCAGCRVHRFAQR